MARPTDDYVEQRFYEIFYQLPTPEQSGIIRGLDTVRRMRKSQLPLEAFEEHVPSSEISAAEVAMLPGVKIA